MRRPLTVTLVLAALLSVTACSGSEARPEPEVKTSFEQVKGEKRLVEEFDQRGEKSWTVRVSSGATGYRVRMSCVGGAKDSEVAVRLSDGWGTASPCDPESTGSALVLLTDIKPYARAAEVTITLTPPRGSRWSVAVDATTDETNPTDE